MNAVCSFPEFREGTRMGQYPKIILVPEKLLINITVSRVLGNRIFVIKSSYPRKHHLNQHSDYEKV